MMMSSWKPVPFVPAAPSPKPMGNTWSDVRFGLGRGAAQTYHKNPVKKSTENRVRDFAKDLADGKDIRRVDTT